jgi:hypothetical protein
MVSVSPRQKSFHPRVIQIELSSDDRVFFHVGASSRKLRVSSGSSKAKNSSSSRQEIPAFEQSITTGNNFANSSETACTEPFLATLGETPNASKQTRRPLGGILEGSLDEARICEHC